MGPGKGEGQARLEGNHSEEHFNVKDKQYCFPKIALYQPKS